MLLRPLPSKNSKPPSGSDMNEINKEHHLVLIEWEDSAQPKPNWVFLSEFEAPEIVKCMSVGWMIFDGQDVKALAPNIGKYDDLDSAQGSGVICIPSRSITRLVTLKGGKSLGSF